MAVLSNSLTKEYKGEGLITLADLCKVLDDLIKKKMVGRIYDEGSTGNGILKLSPAESVKQYALEQGYVTTEVIIKYIDSKSDKTIKMFVDQLFEIGDLQDDLNKQKEYLSSKIKEHEKKIANFNNSIISIMAILIAAFSIIGFNIGGIKFIVGSNDVLKPWEYAGSIAIINLSIVFSLYFLFYLLNKIVNPNNRQAILEDDKQGTKKVFSIFNNKLVIFLLIVIIILICICFFIA